jgi:hypothetical protein
MGDYLSGLWCPDAGGARAIAGPRADTTFLARLASLGGDDLATLLAIATDATAPVQARVRALVAVGKSAPPAEALAVVAAAAEAPDVPTPVRLAALRAAQAASPVVGRDLATRLAADGDRLLAGAAARR